MLCLRRLAPFLLTIVAPEPAGRRRWRLPKHLTAQARCPDGAAMDGILNSGSREGFRRLKACWQLPVPKAAPENRNNGPKADNVIDRQTRAA